MILFRAVGLEELRLIDATRMRAFPPRLFEQPIFYQALSEEFARQMARDWNTRYGSRVGFVTRFEVDDAYLVRFERHLVGTGSHHEELWVPAEQLSEFNGHIVGGIAVVEAYFGEGWRELRARDADAKKLLADVMVRVEDEADRLLAAADAEPAGALRLAGKAVEILRPVCAAFPRRQYSAWDLARALGRRARAHYAAGDLDGAWRDTVESASICRAELAEGRDMLFWLADALEHCVTFAREREDWQSMLDLSAEWAATLPRLLAQQEWAGEDTELTRTNLGSALGEVAKAHRALGNHGASRSAYETALGYHREHAAFRPGKWRAVAHVAEALGELGWTLAETGDVEGARARYVEARESFADARRRFPSEIELVGLQRLLLDRAAQFHESREEFDEALVCRRQQIAASRAIAWSDPSTDACEDVRFDLVNLGELHELRGERADAIEAYREAVTIARGVAAERSSEDGGASDLVYPLLQLRNALTSAGARDEALVVARELVGFQRIVVASDPADFDMLRELLVDVSELGQLLADSGDAAAAAKSYEEAEAIARGLVASDGDRTVWRDDLEITLSRRARLALDAGDHGAAVCGFSASADELRVLVTQDPAVVKWRMRLGTRLADLGEAHSRWGNAELALAAYEEAVGRLLSLRGAIAGWSEEDFGEIVRDAAEAASAAGRPDRAVELRSIAPLS